MTSSTGFCNSTTFCHFHHNYACSHYMVVISGVVLKTEVGERLEIEVETVAKSAVLQEFCIV